MDNQEKHPRYQEYLDYCKRNKISMTFEYYLKNY